MGRITCINYLAFNRGTTLCPVSSSPDMTPREVLRSWIFYAVWLTYFFEGFAVDVNFFFYKVNYLCIILKCIKILFWRVLDHGNSLDKSNDKTCNRKYHISCSESWSTRLDKHDVLSEERSVYGPVKWPRWGREWVLGWVYGEYMFNFTDRTTCVSPDVLNASRLVKSSTTPLLAVQSRVP